jgi:hypothetical protein
MRRIKSMNDIRVAHVEIKSNNKGKFIAAIVIGLAILAGGIHTYTAGWWKTPPKPVVTSNQLPQAEPLILENTPKPL